MTEALPLFRAAAEIVYLAAYRAAHPRTTPALPLRGPSQPRSLTARAVAHRQLMFRHLTSQMARGARTDVSAILPPG